MLTRPVVLSQYLLNNRSRPEVRDVIADAYEERGSFWARTMPHVSRHEHDGYGYGDGDGGDGDGGDGDGYGDGDGGDGDGYDGDGYDGGYGDGDGGYDDGDSYSYGDGGCGYGDGDGYDGGYGGYGSGDGGQKLTISQEKNLKPGVKIVVLGGGTYSYVLVGLLRQVDGDEWEIAGARCIRRFGSNAALAGLAASGPHSDTQLLEESKQPEEIHRLLVRRAIPCDEAAWAKHLPIAMAAR